MPSGSTQAQGPKLMFQEGEPFPSQAFPAAATGRPVSLADFRGKRTILQIFASW